MVACKQQLTFYRDTRADDKLRLGMTCLIRSASLFGCIYMAINFLKVICKNFLKINTTSDLCLEDLKCRAWCIFFLSLWNTRCFRSLSHYFAIEIFYVSEHLCCALNKENRCWVFIPNVGCFALRILGTSIKIVNKNKLLVWNFLFLPLLRNLYNVTVKSSIPRTLLPVILAKASIHKSAKSL